MRVLLLPVLLLAAAPGPLPEHAVELRNLGIAQLENEQPAQAEATFRELMKVAPADPLPYADLAVSLLRQQKYDAAMEALDQALALAPKPPGRADLLALRGDVLQWSGKAEEALAAYRQATAADPNRVEVWFSLFQQAAAVGETETAQAASTEALAALVRLRPENLVVLLKEGQRAIRAADRTAATKAFLRVKEILWQAPPPAVMSLDQLLKALEENNLEAARIPGVRLENVLKVSPLYQQSLRELSLGIQGIPVEGFVGEPPATSFGDPLPVRFRSTRIVETPTAGRALAAGDFDGDGKTDVARIVSGETPHLELRRGGPQATGPDLPAPGLDSLLAADFDNDGKLDLIASGPESVVWWRGRGDGTFEDATATAGLAGTGATAAAVLDFDIEGDLDLALVGGTAGKTGAGDLRRNNLSGPLESVGEQALPREVFQDPRGLVASDLDRDGDLDLVVAHGKGLSWIDNLRQGRFGDRTAAAGLAKAAPAAAVTSADLDNDGLPDLIAAGPGGLQAWHGRRTAFEPWNLSLPDKPGFSDVLAFDADNDGRLDLAAAGPSGVVILGQHGSMFEALPIEGDPSPVTTLTAADLDGDGDLDLVAAGPSGLHRLDNDGGNRNHWLTVRLKALTQGNSKNNIDGLGSVLEVRSGAAYQSQEVHGQTTHLGLGRRTQPDLLRVLWTNGVPQNRLQPKGDQRIVEEQLLKGSCPFLYAWDGHGFAFVTDLLWNAPIGLPVAPGVWASSDPTELVRADGLKPKDGRYEIRITEELWEAAWFDAVRLWVVDHPADVEVASNLKVIPGKSQPEEVRASRDLRPVAAAWDGAGQDATARVRARDEVYASGFTPSPYQGVAARPWTFTFDLGEAPAAPVRLHLDGWIFPADASLNLAVAQRPDLPPVFPRVEVETEEGWQVLVPEMGFPAGKTKTLVVDTPALPPGAHRLRIVTNQWLGWDRIAWTTAPVDAEAVVVAKLEPGAADLHYRGFSELIRRSPNGPHGYLYSRSTPDSPWLPFPGRYTRYGDVNELLQEPDDRMVILAPGDEIALSFDASGLPPVREGWKRTLFLESHGWDKDADRNTFEATRIEPLPFRAMKRYGEPFPDTPELRRYVDEWLTRVVP
ncbi:MAG TPA: FG-GAP-like repeat-containing protein [Thermoanaerobaculia bacterium]|jgi:Tfp pilus assembly protein PilF|nr:FG-GAP-like repeat-containing protein [Thermoanaerobaculia bacterium]